MRNSNVDIWINLYLEITMSAIKMDSDFNDEFLRKQKSKNIHWSNAIEFSTEVI